MKKAITEDDRVRLLGKAQLIGRLQQMVAESGDPEGFDAAAWLAQWLETPLPALGGEISGEECGGVWVKVECASGTSGEVRLAGEFSEWDA